MPANLLHGFDMYRLKAARYRADVDSRELPIYTPADVARFVGLSQPTLSRWINGRQNRASYFAPVIEIADPENGLMSFFNLVEAHVLAATRYTHKVKFSAIRRALDTLKQKYPSDHPLIDRDFFTNGKDIFLKSIWENENLSTVGQTNMKDIMDKFLVHIERDERDVATKIYPVIKGQPDDRVITIVHGVASGQPVIEGRGVPVFVIYGRHQAGESSRSIAKDFDIAESKVKRAIAYVEKRQEENPAA